MATNIDRLSFQMEADVSQFEEGMRLTRKELQQVNRAMRRSEEPAEKLARDINSLEEAVAAGGAEADQYRQRLERLRKKKADLERDTEAEREEQARLNRELEQAKQVTRSVETASERYQREVRELNGMLRKGHLSQQDYNRALKRQKADLNQARAATAANIPVVGNLTSGMLAGGAAIGGAAVATGGLTAAFYASVRAAEAVTRSVKQSMKELDDLAKQARKLDALPDELAGMQAAAERFSGVGAPQFNMALQRMTRRIQEAARDTGEANKTIREVLELDPEALAAAGPTEAFERIAQAMKENVPVSQRLSTAFKLFDSEGAALITTLTADADALDRVKENAKAAGVAMDAFALQRVEEANDALTDLKDVTRGLSNELTVRLAPAIELIAEDLVGIARESRNAENAFGPQANAIDALGATAVTASGRLQDLKDNMATTLARDAASFIPGAAGEALGDAIDRMAGVSAQDRAAQELIGKGLGETLGRMTGDTPGGPDPIQQELDRRKEAEEELQALRDKLAKASGKTPLIDNATNAQLAEAKKITEEIAEIKRQQQEQEQEDAQVKAARKQLKAMRDQLQVMQMTADEAERFKFAQSGATEEQQKQMEQLQEQLDARRTEKKMEEAGEALRQELEGPQQAFEREIADLKQLMDAGAIGQDTFDRAAMQAAKQFDKAVGQSEQMKELGRPGAAEKGSQEALKAIQGIQDKEAQLKREQAAREERMVKLDERIAKAVEEMNRVAKKAPKIQRAG